MAVDLQDLARRLFKAAETMWTNAGLRPDQYAQPVLALIALRQMEAKFLLVDAKLKPSFTGRLKATPAAYQAKGAMFVPEVARFSRLLALPGNANLGAELTAAMDAIVEHNPDLACRHSRDNSSGRAGQRVRAADGRAAAHAPAWPA